MKKVTAFLVAFLLFIGTAVGAHFLLIGNINFHNPKFGTWVNDKKFVFNEAIVKKLDANSILVFGSSEFAHGKDTKYHPENMFAGQDLHIMMIGAGYYQTLSHAVALSAIQSKEEQKKVVLILSPQWFRKSGVIPEAYASRFSEMNFISMLKNNDLSMETKKYMVERSEKLLAGDPPTLKRAKMYERLFFSNNATIKDRITFNSYNRFLQEKSRIGMVTNAYVAGLRRVKVSQENLDKPAQIQWDAYRKDADIEGEMDTKSNAFHIKDSYYKLRIKSKVASRKDSNTGGNYGVSPEYDDLKTFLKVCKETNVQVLLVEIPVNGWWYDYVGFPKEGREKYYENIRQIAGEYGAQVADFSNNEYTPYFLEDTIHLGWRGWVDVNESIYKFAKKD